MEQIYNEKVLAMFQAVCDLIDEGMEVEKIKVSDVTQKAGIGKGTAYEYFRSKEELLFRALRYDFLQQFQIFHDNLKEAASFEEAIRRGFEWMEEHACNNRMKVQFLKLAQLRKIQEKDAGPSGTGKDFDEDVLKDCFYTDVFHDILDTMISLGVQGKIIDSTISKEFLELDIFSKFMEYFMFMVTRPSDDKRLIDEMRKFIFEGMIRQYETRI